MSLKEKIAVDKAAQRYVLVYQRGIANIFRVPSFIGYTEGANKRVLQSDFRTAEAMCRGLLLAGASVRVASCNVAGDCAELVWAQGLSDCPLREAARPPKLAS